jgi:hypothetical protein
MSAKHANMSREFNCDADIKHNWLVERRKMGKCMWLDIQEWKHHLEEVSLNARILQHQTNLGDTGMQLGTRFIWLTIVSSTMWHWCTFVCVNGGNSMSSRGTYIFRSWFYTMDPVNWFWWYVDPVMRAAKSNMTSAFNLHLFIRLYVNVVGILPVLKFHFCGTRY